MPQSQSQSIAGGYNADGVELNGQGGMGGSHGEFWVRWLIAWRNDGSAGGGSGSDQRKTKIAVGLDGWMVFMLLLIGCRSGIRGLM
jgi:hypothetical protein